MSRLLRYKSLLRLALGGTADNLALSGIATSVMVTNPFIAAELGRIPASASAAVLGAAGAVWIADRINKEIRLSVFESPLKINSDTPPATKEGVLLGYTVDGGQPVWIPWDDWMRHCFICGMTGVGKTVLGNWLMLQQIINGGGILWIDGKLDADNIRDLRAMLAWAGREDDLLIINPGNPKESNTYNPILFGDPDEIASRILSLIPSSEGNAGTDFYRQAANQGITTLVGAIKATRNPHYNFLDLTILLQNQRALQWLENQIDPHKPERKALSIFLEQFRTQGRDGVSNIDLKKLREVFGGVGGRMHMFGSGNFGEITNTYNPEVNLYEAIRNNKIVYCALPTMGKQEASTNFGKMVVGDFRTAISWIQALPKEERPWPPFLGFFDEAGGYVNDSWSRPFEQSRSAHLVMCPAIQTMANLEAVSEELKEMVVGNTFTKIAFKIGTQDTGEQLADLIGQERTIKHSISAGKGQGQGTQTNDTSQRQTQNMTVSFSQQEDEDYRVSPDDLKALDRGECIVSYGGSKVFHVKVPRIEFDKTFIKELGPVEINRFRTKYKKGLGLFQNIDRWLADGNA